MKRVLVLHGPNLDMLGEREPDVYGKITLKELNRILEDEGKRLGLEVFTFQSNSEEDLILAIHRSKGRVDYIVINPGALTHTSIALRDALLSVSIPVFEVHISNVYRREDFRKRSYISDIAEGVVSGLGVYSYIAALRFIGEQNEG